MNSLIVPDEFINRRGHSLLLAVIIVTLTLIYAGSFRGTWVFDDIPNIVENPSVHLDRLDWSGLQKTFYGMGDSIKRPLAYLSFGLNYYTHGLEVFGYHLVNLIIHGLATVFLYLLIYHMLHLPLLARRYAGQARVAAFAAALLWATSPIQVTAVTYIVQRMASMAALFFIMAMLFYLFGRTAPDPYRKAGWFGLCLLAGLLSLACKENAAMLPVTLYLFDVLLIQGVDRVRFRRHLLLAAIPLALLAGLAFLVSDPIRILTGGGYEDREFTALERLLTQPRVLIFYLSQMIYPIPERFALIHEVQISRSLLAPWTTLPAIGFWLVWLGAGVYLAARRPLISFCLLFFMVNHAVESSIISLELVFEHRNYLPSMALFLLAGLGLTALLRRPDFKPVSRLFVAFALCALVMFHGHGVMQRNGLFANPFLLWSDNVRKAPGMSRVHVNLGNVFLKMNMPEEACRAYEKSLEVNRHHRHSLRAAPLNNLGNYHLKTGDIARALDYYQQALEANRGSWRARMNEIVALLMIDDLPSAAEKIEIALGKVQNNPRLLTMHCMLLFKQGNYHAAIQEAQNVMKMDSEPSNVHRILGESFFRIGRYQKSRQYWLDYVRAFPRDLEANLALVNLSDLLNDENLLRQASNQIMSLKGNQSWQELFQEIERQRDINDLLFTADHWALVPLIERGSQTQTGADLKRQMPPENRTVEDG
jgi:protein O-mannosyl-transferase